MRTFFTIDVAHDTVTTVNGATARAAALKLATAGHSRACIVDGDTLKMHIFDCRRRSMSLAEQSDFSKMRGISTKAEVTRVFYTTLPSHLKNTSGNLDRSALLKHLRR
jgi:ADP-ribosylglycohydrolase